MQMGDGDTKVEDVRCCRWNGGGDAGYVVVIVGGGKCDKGGRDYTVNMDE